MTAVPVNAIINPNTGQPLTAAQAFASWLELNEPALFRALAQRAAASGAAPGLGDWSDFLSSVGSVASDLGSDISGAASSVGDWLASGQGMSSLTNLANTYLQDQTAQSVVQTQLSRAQQGLPPAPISYTTSSSGAVVPVYTASSIPSSIAPYVTGSPVNLGSGGTGVPISGQALGLLSGAGGLSQYLPYILLLGGAGLLVALFA